jgi:hypothetical protein
MMTFTWATYCLFSLSIMQTIALALALIQYHTGSQYIPRKELILVQECI